MSNDRKWEYVSGEPIRHNGVLIDPNSETYHIAATSLRRRDTIHRQAERLAKEIEVRGLCEEFLRTSDLFEIYPGPRTCGYVSLGGCTDPANLNAPSISRCCMAGVRSHFGPRCSTPGAP